MVGQGWPDFGDNSLIIAHWEPPAAFNGFQLKKYFAQWSHTCKAFGVTDLWFVELDDMPEFGDSEVDVLRFASLDEALSATDKEPVYIEHGGAPLFGYSFPDAPVFVFGSDYGELPKADIEIVGGPLHAHVACGVVLAWHSATPI